MRFESHAALHDAPGPPTGSADIPPNFIFFFLLSIAAGVGMAPGASKLRIICRCCPWGKTPPSQGGKAGSSPVTGSMGLRIPSCLLTAGKTADGLERLLTQRKDGRRGGAGTTGSPNMRRARSQSRGRGLARSHGLGGATPPLRSIRVARTLSLPGISNLGAGRCHAAGSQNQNQKKGVRI